MARGRWVYVEGDGWLETGCSETDQTGTGYVYVAAERIPSPTLYLPDGSAKVVERAKVIGYVRPSGA